MKVTVEAHVSNWTPPEKVIFDEGMKTPIACVSKDIIQKLCMNWLDDICAKAGMTFEIVFDMLDEPSE